MKRIFCTGDIHADTRRIEQIALFCTKNDTTEEDSMIILGDVGINYWLDERDNEIKEFMSTIPITFLCIHGNHEERPRNISTYKYINTKEYGGVWYEDEYPNILFLDDGEHIINGKRFLVASGAYSIDKNYRLIRGWHWFKDEQMSEEDKCRVREVVKNNNKFDYVLSHTCPIEYEPTYLFLPSIEQSTVDKSMEFYLQEIYNLIDKEYLRQWLYGHFHDDKQLDNKFTILFKDTILLEDRKIEKEE